MTSILDEAKEAVYGPRQAAYGDPRLNHGCTAAMFSAYVSRKYGIKLDFDRRDIPIFNMLQKISRDAHRPQRDNMRDVAGYAENAERCT